MTSKIDIIASAFLLLGKEPPNNIGVDAPQAARNASFLYDQYYDAFLTRYNWRFALTQFTLNKLTTFDPIPEFNYAYELPSDWLSISRVSKFTDYLIYGNKLYCGIAQDLKLFYVKHVDEGELPIYYIEFLIEKFAELFAMKLTQNTDLVKLWGDSANEKLNRAIALDASTQPSLVIQDNRVAAAKYSSGVL